MSCPRCNGRLWGHSLWCPACGLEARDIDDRPMKVCEPETWEIPENQMALFDLPKVRSGAVSTMDAGELEKWEARYK